jgi:phospholipase C
MELKVPESDRRSFLKILGSGAVAAALQESIGKALALPANNKTRSIHDVEHIVIFMQENRSFEHYFGALRGVRGFDDPRAVRLPSGNPVWNQPNGSGTLLPFRPEGDSLGLTFFGDTPHDWNSTHRAWNNGNWDDWVAQKSTTTMLHFDRRDVPYHYALADAFTICDAYHCSVLGPTYPNRNYMFTGWTGNDGKGNGPQLDTSGTILDWPTYPEQLQVAGISWKVYQDTGSGLTAANNWGDDPDHYIGNSANNTLLRFVKYQNAPDSDPLAQKARTGTNIAVSGTLFDDLQRDVTNNTLPQISWIMCPTAYDEHPNFPANYGAFFISSLIDTLTSNPEVWSKTALFLTYDENDGFFDHMVPPTAPGSAAEGHSTVSTKNEYFTGNTTHDAGPFGLGPRVPMIVISPWSKGGWVNSELFDHSSLIRFIETRFGQEYPDLIEQQITPWRRAVAGDLTSAFDFENPNVALTSLPSTAAYAPPDRLSHPNAPITLPTSQVMPIQEPGQRPARAVPYQLQADAKVDINNTLLTVSFVNTGTAGAVFQVRTALDALSHGNGNGPWCYTVDPVAQSLSDKYRPLNGAAYDLSVYGPNGFFRRFAGALTPSSANLAVQAEYDTSAGGIAVTVTNVGAANADVAVVDNYMRQMHQHDLEPGESFQTVLTLQDSSSWYDLLITVNSDPRFIRHYAGHVETGKDSFSDPLIGQRVA